MGSRAPCSRPSTLPLRARLTTRFKHDQGPSLRRNGKGVRILISPTEPAPLRAIGKTSLVPESYGADILIHSPVFGPVGIQRKEIRDLVASIYDGRLGRQLTQMKQLGQGLLLLEGRPQWTNDGLLIGSTNWTINQHLGLMWLVQSRGIWLASVETLSDTISYLLAFQKWCQKERHSTLATRPKAKDEWGKRVVGGKDFAVFLLQSFPGIGADTAAAIYNHFGGLPLSWTITEQQLQQVPGVGKTRAKTLLNTLGRFDASSLSTSTAKETKKRGSGTSRQPQQEDDLSRTIAESLHIDLTVDETRP